MSNTATGESSNPVTVSCPNHLRELANGLWNFVGSQRGTDLELDYGDGRSVRAHRIVVEVFLPADRLCRSALDHHHSDDDMRSLLEFVYNGSVTVAGERLDALLRLARELDFKLLMEAVEAASGDAAAVRSRPVRGRRLREHPGKNSKAETPPGCSSRSDAIHVAPAVSDKTTKRKLRLTKSRAEQLNRFHDDHCESMSTSTSAKSDIPTLSVDDGAAVATNSSHKDGNARTTEALKKRRGARAKAATSVPSTGLSKADRRRLLREQLPLLSCEQCDYSTRLKDRFRVHRARHDPGSTIFSCAFCSQAFLCRQSFEKHQARHTLNRCEHCEFETMKNWKFYQHLFHVHRVNVSGQPVANNVKCPDCDFTCKLESKLRHHAREKHSGEKPFKCEHCSYASSRKAVLERHVRLTHLGIRREPSCMCEQCGQRCYNQFDLKEHKRSHTDEKPYKCTICDQSYKYGSTFRRHKQTHANNDKPFVCHLCGFCCSRQDNLRVHIRGVHKLEQDLETS